MERFLEYSLSEAGLSIQTDDDRTAYFFLSYVLLILNSLMMMSNVFLLMTRSLASAERIMKVIDEPIDITDENARNIKLRRAR